MKKISVLLICLFLLITACSRLDIAVQLATTYVANKADDYFDLTRAQSKWLKSNFDRDFSKVKQTIFPQLSSEMLRVASLVESKPKLDEIDVEYTYERIKNLTYDAMRFFSDDAVLFADQLTPKQIVYFKKEFEEKMKDLKEDSGADESYKKMKKHFDSWMGMMTSAQKKELESFTKNNPAPINEVIAYRQYLANQFIKSYQEKNSRKQFVEKLFSRYESLQTISYTQSSQLRTAKLIQETTKILNMMTNDQRQVLIKTLRDRAKQISAIAL